VKVVESPIGHGTQRMITSISLSLLIHISLGTDSGRDEHLKRDLSAKIMYTVRYAYTVTPFIFSSSQNELILVVAATRTVDQS
jgi:hypothetical protein